ncbi:hypothetical protein Ancab_038365 [Ancistrocladus abbreviatus]
MENSTNGREELNQPLITQATPSEAELLLKESSRGTEKEEKLMRVWIESKKLWHIAGPSILSRVASFSMNVVTVAFAGHLGDLDLAALSIANNVFVGFSFGLLFFERLYCFGCSH